MFKAAGTVIAACGIYFAVGVAMTAGCVIGAALAEKITEKFEN